MFDFLVKKQKTATSVFSNEEIANLELWVSFTQIRYYVDADGYEHPVTIDKIYKFLKSKVDKKIELLKEYAQDIEDYYSFTDVADKSTFTVVFKQLFLGISTISMKMDMNVPLMFVVDDIEMLISQLSRYSNYKNRIKV